MSHRVEARSSKARGAGRTSASLLRRAATRQRCAAQQRIGRAACRAACAATMQPHSAQELTPSRRLAVAYRRGSVAYRRGAVLFSAPEGGPVYLPSETHDRRLRVHLAVGDRLSGVRGGLAAGVAVPELHQLECALQAADHRLQELRQAVLRRPVVLEVGQGHRAVLAEHPAQPGVRAADRRAAQSEDQGARHLPYHLLPAERDRGRGGVAAVGVDLQPAFRGLQPVSCAGVRDQGAGLAGTTRPG